MVLVLSIVFLCALSQAFCADPSNYEYYTEGGIKSGLKADSDHFTLNGKEIRLLSGSLHYFRLPAEYWRDRLLKFKAAGLNTVQTYIAWNLHEDRQGEFDFETGNLNLAEFLKIAKEVDLFVYIRIGPYICAEWEFGGYPAWLLKDANMKFRSNYKGHLDATQKYFNKVLSIMMDHQFKKGGSIIALQFENEYGGINNANDKEYFQFMKDVIDKSGWNELLTNCDSGMTAASAAPHVLPGVLETDNFNSNSLKTLEALRKALGPNKPLHVTEWWPGWFDDWGQGHHRMSVATFEKEVTDVLFNANSSINFYMFFGGTNFGFMNGGDGGGNAKITSYDYDAPLSESGNYTDKYYKTRQLIEKLVKERNLPKVHIPDYPKVVPAVGYGDIKITDYLSFDDLLSKIKPIATTEVKTMEYFDQNYGYILYRFSANKFKKMKLTRGCSDHATIMIDGKVATTMSGWNDWEMTSKDSEFDNKTTEHRVDILVENVGRDNGGDLSSQRKGLYENVLVDSVKIAKYEVFSLDFKQAYVKGLKDVKGMAYQAHMAQTSPTLYRAELDIKGQPSDTFIRTDNWTKGIVIVNGINIGRYNSAGPQKTLYLPAPFLKTGANDIYVFELTSSTADKIQSVSVPDLGK